ncbi:hypothetical protein [Paenibacillus sp. GCM10023250]|uniref:hypothetical protein n=1 Tax=Paenibacillus sp. GCM10023250 TaxID=3252648 RepID=UPI00362095F3
MKRMLAKFLLWIGLFGMLFRTAIAVIERKYGYSLIDGRLLDGIEILLALECLLVAAMLLHKYAAQARFYWILLALGAAVLYVEFRAAGFGDLFESNANRYYYDSPTRRYRLLLEESGSGDSAGVRAYQVENRFFKRTSDRAFAALGASEKPISAADLAVDWTRENVAKVTVTSGGKAQSFELAFNDNGVLKAIMDRADVIPGEDEAPAAS